LITKERVYFWQYSTVFWVPN